MEGSLLYKLVGSDGMEGVEVDRNRFKRVFASKYGKVLIYRILSVSKESKEWVADPANRLCDAPGSWFCPGQYPPALKKVLREKKDFKQLEDFNRKGDEDAEASEYQQQYMENVMKKREASASANNPEKPRTLSSVEIEAINERWENSEAMTQLWSLILE